MIIEKAKGFKLLKRQKSSAIFDQIWKKIFKLLKFLNEKFKNGVKKVTKLANSLKKIN